VLFPLFSYHHFNKTESQTYQCSHHEVVIRTDVVKESKASEHPRTHDNERDRYESDAGHYDRNCRWGYSTERHTEDGDDVQIDTVKQAPNG
jgi:hypothetical protein